MGEEQRYRCKVCHRMLSVPDRVYQLMKERGERLPARCEEHRAEHKRETRGIKVPYFEASRRPQSEFSRFDYFQSLYTSHGDRARQEVDTPADTAGMRIRITDDHIRDLFRLLRDNQVVILSSPTGTGKSVYVLYRLLEAPDTETKQFIDNLIRQGQIIQTQPLSSAVERIPKTVSERLLGDSDVGEFSTIGLRHAGKEDYGAHNLAVVVTDGSLRNWIRDGHVGRYSLVIIDEAHKRTVNIDSLLTLLRARLHLYPHLKLLISSATIAAEEFKRSFESAGLKVAVLDLAESLAEQIAYSVHFWDGSVEGRCNCWACNRPDRGLWPPWFAQRSRSPDEAELPQVVSEVVLTILRETLAGGILVFLPGQARIEDAAELIEEKKRSLDPRGEIPVLPIYRRVGEAEVTRRFNQLGKQRRVILATDIAETSHTLDDIEFVVDCGYIKEHRWDPESETSSLPTVRHSQAGCKQRWGRVGRTRRGYVYCLYTHDEFALFPEQTLPEVYRSNLEEYLLTLRSAGVMGAAPIMGSVENAIAIQRELVRADGALQATGFLDRGGDVTERALELFRVPLGAAEKALLDAADEQNCLFEMLTALLMMRSSEGVPRTGAGLYDRANGLLVWDTRWSAATKDRVRRIQQGLVIGCQDDLDFVLALAARLGDAEVRGVGTAWAAYHFVNYDTLKTVLKARGDLLDIYRARTWGRELRDIDLRLVQRGRSAMVALLGNSKEILIHEGGPVLGFSRSTSSQHGAVSPHCVGGWQAGDRAVMLMATRTTTVVDRQSSVGSVACFLVRPTFSLADISGVFAATQAYPVGSRVTVEQRNRTSVVRALVGPPLPVDVTYREEMTFGVLTEDSARRKIVGRLNWPSSDQQPQAVVESPLVGAEWLDSEDASEPAVTGVLLGFSPDGQGLKAILGRTESRRQAASDIRGKRAGDTLSVSIVKVERDAYGKGGWAIARTPRGFDIPVELSDLSLDVFGPGLEKVKGLSMQLRIKELQRGIPRLTNFDAITDDLQGLIKELAESGQLQMGGLVEDVDLARNEITVVVPRPGGVVHAFQIAEDGRPGRAPRTPEGDVSFMSIGEPVILDLKLSPRPGAFSPYYWPRQHELDSLPRTSRWRFEKDKARLVFPLRLSPKDLESWTADQDTKDRVFRASWRYCLLATVEKRNAYADITPGQEVAGVVFARETRGAFLAAEGVWVRVTVGDVRLLGFIPSNDLSGAWDSGQGDGVRRIPNPGDQLRLRVTSVDPETAALYLEELAPLSV